MYLLDPFHNKLQSSDNISYNWVYYIGLVYGLEHRIYSKNNGAIDYDNKIHPDEVEFYTNDLCLFHIANLFFGNDSIKSVIEKPIEDYMGYKEVSMNQEEMSAFYMLP